MIANLKALIVVLAIAAAVFSVAKPICLRFMAEEDFARRRGIWFALTVAAFVSPNFWLFAAVALPLLYWGARKDPNPVAFYVLVFCVISPIIRVEIPAFGVNAFFPMNLTRILAFAILIPVALEIIQSQDKKLALKFTAMDFFVLAYGVLQVTLLMPYESSTNTLRRAFLYFLDVMVLYFVATRACSTRQAIEEILASFCLLCAILASLAVFESLRGWLLYEGIAVEWGSGLGGIVYAMRDDFLRAQVSVGHSIPLGYLLAFGYGVWVYLGSRVQSRKLSIAFSVLMWAGMIAAHSRAGWVAGVAVYFACIAFGPKGPSRLVKSALIFAMIFGLVLLSPLGGRVIDNLPFVGTVGQENVEYRQQLAEASWAMVRQNPVFGNPFVLKYMESLRQGEGIIDLVNTYAQIAMFYGLTGLFFYLGPYLIGIWKAFDMSRRSARLDPGLSLLGAAVIACMFGFLLAMGMGGFGPDPQSFSMVIIGIAVGYARLDPLKVAPRVAPLPRPGTQSQWSMKRG